MKKLTNTETELKKRVAYKETGIRSHVPVDIIKFLFSKKSIKANKN